jgi:hypothetical protein
MVANNDCGKGVEVMKTIQAAILVACAAGALAITPVATAAKSFSNPARGFHSPAPGLARTFPRARPFGNFSRWPLSGYSQWPRYDGFYGGYIATSSDGPGAVSYVIPERVIYVPLPPQALTCKHSVEKVSVPAEGGGMREITVTRC